MMGESLQILNTQVIDKKERSKNRNQIMYVNQLLISSTGCIFWIGSSSGCDNCMAENMLEIITNLPFKFKDSWLNQLVY